MENSPYGAIPVLRVSGSPSCIVALLRVESKFGSRLIPFSGASHRGSTGSLLLEMASGLPMLSRPLADAYSSISSITEAVKPNPPGAPPEITYRAQGVDHNHQWRDIHVPS